MPVALEWGPIGAKTLAERSDVIVVVDVLSFCTSVSVAVERGARVWPHAGGEDAQLLARQIDAELAGHRLSHDGPTLSPASLLGSDEQTRLVLPSPNGSSIAHAAAGPGAPVVAACLRNATAVALYLRYGRYDRSRTASPARSWSTRASPRTSASPASGMSRQSFRCSLTAASCGREHQEMIGAAGSLPTAVSAAVRSRRLSIRNGTAMSWNAPATTKDVP